MTPQIAESVLGKKLHRLDVANGVDSRTAGIFRERGKAAVPLLGSRFGLAHGSLWVARRHCVRAQVMFRLLSVSNRVELRTSVASRSGGPQSPTAADRPLSRTIESGHLDP